jgi:SnoaL-like domain
VLGTDETQRSPGPPRTPDPASRLATEPGLRPAGSSPSLRTGGPFFLDAKAYRGRDETKQFWRKTQELFAEIQWEPREFTDLGHAVVVAVRVSGLGRGSDVPIESDEANVFWFRDGALVRLQAFPTEREALAAAERSRSDLDDDR